MVNVIAMVIPGAKICQSRRTVLCGRLRIRVLYKWGQNNFFWCWFAVLTTALKKDCSATRLSEVITRVSYNEISNNRTRQPLAAASETELRFLGIALIFCQSKHEDSTVRLCGRVTAAFHITYVFHTAGPHCLWCVTAGEQEWIVPAGGWFIVTNVT